MSYKLNYLFFQVPSNTHIRIYYLFYKKTEVRKCTIYNEAPKDDNNEGEGVTKITQNEKP